MISYNTLLAIIQEAYDDNWTPECLANYLLQAIADREVAVPVSVGDCVYFVIDEFPQFGGPYVATEYISDVSYRGFFYTDDGGTSCFIPYSAINEDCFLTREEAEEAVKHLKNKEANK